MAANLTQAFEVVITNIRNLVSDEDYKTIAGVFDEISRLKGRIQSKDIKLGNLSNEITELKSRHKNRLQEDLELYRTQHNKLEGDKAKLTEKISTLEAVIQLRDAALAEHTRTQDALQGQLDEITALLDAEKGKVKAANEGITKLQQIIKERSIEIENLRDSLRKEETQNSKAKGTAQDLRDEIASLKGNLLSSTTRLDEIESFAPKLQEGDEAVWIKQLDEVWEAACTVVTSLFGEDLAEERLKDRSAWKDFRESRYLDRAIPLPRSNSPAAKQMRIAALLAILARSITQHVLQPTYILEDKDEEDEIRSLLVHLAITNSKKESFCRALLLSIFPEDQAVNGTKAVERVVKEVPWCVRNLVSDAQYESFRSSVEGIVQKARGAWRLVQGTREKFEPFFELNNYVDFEWQLLNFDNGRVGVGDESPDRARDDEALLMIFPRIYIIADSEPDPVTPGVVLMKSQSTPAAKEMERNKPFSPTARVGPKSVRQRSKAEQTLRDVENTEDGFIEELSVGYVKADRTAISLSWLWLWLMSIYSPPLASYQRISYICGCGELSYLDVRELSPGGIERFRQRLVNSASAVRNLAQDPPTSSHPALPAQVHLDNNMNTPHISTPQLRRPTLSRLENIQAVSTTFQTLDWNAPEDPQYLLLCVNTKNSTALVNVEVGSLGNDQYMFHHIYHEYQRLRREHEWRIALVIPPLVYKLLHMISARVPRLPSPPSWLNLLPILCNALSETHLHKIASGDFVRFQLIPIREADCPRWFKKREFPPVTEVRARRYLYEPVPMDDVELADIPLQHLLKPGPHTDRFWITMSPKKLGGQLARRPGADGQRVIGWGIRINEELNWGYILLLILTILIVIGFSVVVYAAITSDNSSAFGLGAFLVAFFTVYITYQYFAWKEEFKVSS